MIANYIIQKAISTAKKSDVLRAKVAAVAFTDSGKIVAFCSNCRLYGHFGKFTIHAEKRLLAKLCRLNTARFGHLNILVLRWMKGEDTISNAKPCVECDYLLRKTGFTVYYSDDNGDIKELA